MAIKQSETIIIKRSQINLNPFNPKNHTDEEVKNQVKNIKKVGFNGGIKWNRLSGNLIDGHRRCKAMDIINKYDGAPQTDYDIKVEAVEFDNKTEMEQMTYEALGNTKADYALVADYAGSIDFTGIGLSSADVNAISALMDTVTIPEVETFDDMIMPDLNTPDDLDERKEKVKDMKQQIKEKAIERNRNENAHITLSFTTMEAKEAFCDLMGIASDENFCKGEKVLGLIE